MVPPSRSLRASWIGTKKICSWTTRQGKLIGNGNDKNRVICASFAKL